MRAGVERPLRFIVALRHNLAIPHNHTAHLTRPRRYFPNPRLLQSQTHERLVA